MPEYLSPGVYIEEVPARLKAIEGVSTSTAGMVGRAERGPIAGATPPFVPASGPGLRMDDAPTLVTSFGDFTRVFGAPADDPGAGGYTAHAARAFFANGGKRLYIARVVASDASYARIVLGQGARLRLVRRVSNGDQTLFFASVRGLVAGPIALLQASDDSTVGSATIASVDTVANSVTLSMPLTLTTPIEPRTVYVAPAMVTYASAGGAAFYARNPGAWGNALRVAIASADRPAVPLTAPLVVGDTAVALQQTGSFYVGAIVELSNATSKQYAVCRRVTAGHIELVAATSAALAASGAFARVLEIDITVTDTRTGTLETHRGLSWNPDTNPEVQRRYYAAVLNARSRLVYVESPASESPDLNGQPGTPNAFESAGPVTADEGSDGATPGDTEYVGSDFGPGTRTGIQALQDVEDLRVIACPESSTRSVQEALLGQCERMRYRFAVLDAPEVPTTPVVNALLAHRDAYDSSFGAYYAPWVEVNIGDRTVRLPPSGHVMGIYARTDNERGVWKAPANEVVRGIVGLSSYITTGEQDILNPRGVNAIRRFEGQGTRVWGARTLSSDPEYRYVNVRRFLIFLEASIDRATQWVVFEPNAPPTWSRVVNSVTAFLHTQWRGGALLGAKPEDAFYVRCDESTMTVDDIQNGRLICDIGVAIVRPAEFVIFRIEQLTGADTN